MCVHCVFIRLPVGVVGGLAIPPIHQSIVCVLEEFELKPLCGLIPFASLLFARVNLMWLWESHLNSPLYGYVQPADSQRGVFVVVGFQDN